MAVSESSRRELQEALVGAIGPEPTDTLLGYLPPVGWADVATKRDLDAFGAELRGEIARLDGKIDALAGRLGGEIQRLDSKIDALAGRLGGEIEGLNGKIDGLTGRLDGKIEGLDGKIVGLAGTLEARMEHGFRVQFFWMVTLQLAVLGVLLGCFFAVLR